MLRMTVPCLTISTFFFSYQHSETQENEINFNMGLSSGDNYMSGLRTFLERFSTSEL